jgi:alpha-methylacyl-CoA racemase
METTQGDHGGLLAGLKVLDLTQFTPGPYAALLLSDLGAKVLKVEPPHGDPQRIDGPMDADGVSAWYKLMNRNKCVVKVDLKTAEGVDVVSEFLKQADVLLESYRPGVLDRLGFGRNRIATLNSRLVHCALSGWGQTGPYRLRPGHDLNYMAYGGALVQSGTADTPVMTSPPVADFAGSLTAALMITSAIVARCNGGGGCFIDVSLAEAVLGWISPDLTASLRPGLEPRRGQSPYNGGLACYQIYRTADDRFITLGIVEEKFWRGFCEAVQRPDWLSRQWEPVPQHALTAEIADLIGTGTLAEWESRLASAETCFHPVLELDEIMAHPQTMARGLIQQSEGADPIAEVLFPAWLNGRPPPPRKPHRDLTIAEALALW